MLKSVLEIGINTLRRDYQHYLIRTWFLLLNSTGECQKSPPHMGLLFWGADDELCTGQQLAPFLDETLALGEQLDRVCRLHNVLEIATLVKNFMDLPLQNMRELVTLVLLCCRFVISPTL
jgi:hypothetical protein